MRYVTLLHRMARKMVHQVKMLPERDENRSRPVHDLITALWTILVTETLRSDWHLSEMNPCQVVL